MDKTMEKNDEKPLDQEDQQLVSEAEALMAKIEDPEVKSKIGTLVARNKHWRTKALGTQPVPQTEERKVEAPSSSAPGGNGAVAAASTPSSSDDIDTVLRLRTEGKSDDEILTLRQYAKKLNIPISELANDPIIKAGLEAKSAAAKSSAATPSPSSGSPVVAGKTWKEMNAAERKANAPTVVQEILRKKKGGYQ